MVPHQQTSPSCLPLFNTFTFQIPCGRLPSGETIVDTNSSVKIDHITNCMIQRYTINVDCKLPFIETPCSVPFQVFAVTVEQIRFAIRPTLTIRTSTGVNRVQQYPIQTRSVGLGTSLNRLIVVCYRCTEPTTYNLGVDVLSSTTNVKGPKRLICLSITLRLICL